jgi:hypothetical protein
MYEFCNKVILEPEFLRQGFDLTRNCQKLAIILRGGGGSISVGTNFVKIYKSLVIVTTTVEPWAYGIWLICHVICLGALEP